MTKSYAGEMTEFTDEVKRVVTRAIITKQRIAVDWLEEGVQGGIVTTSEDGVTYRGHYGYPRPEERYHGDFRVYKGANDEILLLGEWWRTDTPDGGMWLFRLTPTETGT